MTEIRTIRADEADQFLHLLCDVFELDFGRARHIFFHEPFFDLNRKWALFSNGEIVSVLTTVPLEFGFGNGVGIAGVATKKSEQSKGFGRALLKQVLEAGAANNEPSAYLFAKDPRVYEACGFEAIDEVIEAEIFLDDLNSRDAMVATYDEVRQMYDHWASGSPNRLRRTGKRWEFWQWNLRICTLAGEGYVCQEGQQIREFTTSQWPLSGEYLLVALKSMAAKLPYELSNAKTNLHFMAFQSPAQPEMFMTDQF